MTIISLFDYLPDTGNFKKRAIASLLESSISAVRATDGLEALESFIKNEARWLRDEGLDTEAKKLTIAAAKEGLDWLHMEATDATEDAFLTQEEKLAKLGRYRNEAGEIAKNYYPGLMTVKKIEWIIRKQELTI